MSNGGGGLGDSDQDRGFFGHPRGLSVLFFSELWERFSFYGMRALLTLYMVKELGYSRDPMAYGIYGAYGALVYAFPILGGYLANRWLGYRRAIILGGSLMALGHFAMAIPALERFGLQGEFWTRCFESSFFVALALLCLGNGFFKPNISSTVGRLYREGDPRRDGGFSIFYMGINIGALLAPLVCGQLGEKVNWHLGFSLAGFGMLIGLVWFILKQETLGGQGEPDDQELLVRPVLGPLNRLHLTVLGAFAVVPLVALGLYHHEYVQSLVQVITVAVVVILVAFIVRLEGRARSRMIALVVLMFFHTLFWGGFEQAGSSFNILTDEHVSRSVLGTDFAASAYQAVNPVLIVLLAPLFSMLWPYLGKRRMEPGIPLKFALALAQMALGFVVLIVGMRQSNDFASVALFWMMLCYLFHTTGELCISPVGLSAVTKLAPRRWVGFCMGAWFLTIANGHIVAAAIAKLTADDGSRAATTVDDETKKRIIEALGSDAATPKIADLAQRFGVGVENILAVEEVQREILGRVAKQRAVDETTGETTTVNRRSSEIGNGAAQAEVAASFGIDVQLVHDWRKLSLEKYESAFRIIIGFALGAAALLVVLSPWMKRLLEGVDDPSAESATKE
jgi:POT family proton-dependent oligopeptide transporter